MWFQTFWCLHAFNWNIVVSHACVSSFTAAILRISQEFFARPVLKMDVSYTGQLDGLFLWGWALLVWCFVHLVVFESWVFTSCFPTAEASRHVRFFASARWPPMLCHEETYVTVSRFCRDVRREPNQDIWTCLCGTLVFCRGFYTRDINFTLDDVRTSGANAAIKGDYFAFGPYEALILIYKAVRGLCVTTGGRRLSLSLAVPVYDMEIIWFWLGHQVGQYSAMCISG